MEFIIEQLRQTGDDMLMLYARSRIWPGSCLTWPGRSTGPPGW